MWSVTEEMHGDRELGFGMDLCFAVGLCVLGYTL